MATRMDFNRGVTKEVSVASTVVANDPVRVGDLMGVAMTNALLADDGLYYSTVAFTGVYSSVGTGDIASGAVNQGAPIYTSTAAGAANIGVKATLTTSDGAGANDLFGYTLNTRVGVTGNLEIKVVN